MNSFQAKIGWKRMRKREIKIIVPFCSYPMRNGKFQKNNKKIKNYHCGFISSQNILERLWKRENKNYPSLPFLPDAWFKKIAKKFKKLKDTIMASFQAFWLEKSEKERNQKLSFRSVPTRCVIENKKKNNKKIQKIKKYHYKFISSHNRLEKG